MTATWMEKINVGRDWNEPHDKGPPIEERERHRKKGGGKKPFIIQCRYVGPRRTWLTEWFEKWREWHTYSRYKTERARADALKTLQHRAANSHRIYLHYEYRIPPEETA